jgi:hypothetical protein
MIADEPVTALMVVQRGVLSVLIGRSRSDRKMHWSS